MVVLLAVVVVYLFIGSFLTIVIFSNSKAFLEAKIAHRFIAGMVVMHGWPILFFLWKMYRGEFWRKLFTDGNIEI